MRPAASAAAVLLCLGSVLAAASAATPAALAAPTVPTAINVERRMVERIVTADAVIESTHQATVAAQTSGKVLSVAVDAGQSVRKGQLLAVLDAREAAAGVDQAAALASQAQSRLADARQHWERTRSLKERGFVSQATLDQARAALETAEAGERAAQSGAALASVVRSHSQVVAPMDGLVSARLVEPGDLALPGKPLFIVHQPGSLRAVANVSATALSQSMAPRVVAVHVSATGKTLRPGQLTILPAVDARDLSQRIRVELPEPLSAIPGMTARIEFAQGQIERMVVPVTAIQWRGELATVRVADAGGRQSLRQIRPGETFAGGWVEVLAGLSAGERVVVENGR